MQIETTNNQPNIGNFERGASVVTGSLLVLAGLRKKSWAGAALAFSGAALIRRGLLGHCEAYHALGITTKTEDEGHVSIPYGKGVRVDKTVTVNKPRFEVYQFWRNLENLPSFMQHLERVRPVDDTVSHWVAKAPLGRTVEWDAEILTDEPGELIGWRSLPGADVANAGSVHFRDAAGNRGTEVKVELQYLPPGGVLGALVAKMLGEDPDQQVEDDLRHFKMILETGEVHKTTQEVRKEETQKAAAARSKEEEVMNASEASFPASDAPAWT
jgi:uncharacterized membrane protein